MASFTLDIDEFAAMIGILNAKQIVGMDERIFASYSETNLPRIMGKLEAHGWLQRADQPNSWHTNEDLVEALAVAVAPHFAILGRSKAQPKSVLFYVADTDFVQIVVTNEQVVVTNVADENEVGSCLVKLLDGAWPAEVIVARIRGEAFDAGRVALIDEDGTVQSSIRGLAPDVERPWNDSSLAEFVRESIDELVRS